MSDQTNLTFTVKGKENVAAIAKMVRAVYPRKLLVINRLELKCPNGQVTEDGACL